MSIVRQRNIGPNPIQSTALAKHTEITQIGLGFVRNPSLHSMCCILSEFIIHSFFIPCPFLGHVGGLVGMGNFSRVYVYIGYRILDMYFTYMSASDEFLERFHTWRTHSEKLTGPLLFQGPFLFQGAFRYRGNTNKKQTWNWIAAFWFNLKASKNISACMDESLGFQPRREITVWIIVYICTCTYIYIYISLYINK